MCVFSIMCVLFWKQESMTSSELKKMRRKQRKAELKAQAKVQEEKKGQSLCAVVGSKMNK